MSISAASPTEAAGSSHACHWLCRNMPESSPSQPRPITLWPFPYETVRDAAAMRRTVGPGGVIRIRKRYLDPHERKRASRKAEAA